MRRKSEREYAASQRAKPEVHERIYAYRRSPKGKAIAIRHVNKRRARLNELPYGDVDFQIALQYFDNRCAVCGRQADFWTFLAMDHWIAIADYRKDNPGNVQSNIVPLCHTRKGAPAGVTSCNQSKSNKDPQLWLIEYFGERKAKQILKRINAYFDWVRQQATEIAS